MRKYKIKVFEAATKKPTYNKGDLLEALDSKLKEVKKSVKTMNESSEILLDTNDTLNKLTNLKDTILGLGVDTINAAIDIQQSDIVTASKDIVEQTKLVVKDLASLSGLDKSANMLFVLDDSYISKGVKVSDATISRMMECRDTIAATDDDMFKNVILVKSTNRQANAGAAKELKAVLDMIEPLLEMSDSIVDATIPVSEFEKVRDYVKSAYDKASVVTEVLNATVTKMSDVDLAMLPNESKNEGILSTIISKLKDAAKSIMSVFNKLNLAIFNIDGQAQTAIDVFEESANELALMGVHVTYESVKPGRTYKEWAKNIDTVCSTLIKDDSFKGEFDDDVIYIRECMSGIRSTLSHIQKSLQFNESNMDVVGILADAIQQIVDADDNNDDSDDGDYSKDVISRINKAYSPDDSTPRGYAPSDAGEPDGTPNDTADQDL